MPRNIGATLFMTLDGVIESPEKWSFPYWGDDIAKFKSEELWATDALLLGRKTYEGFAAAWPGRTDEEGFAEKFNSMPKYVVSTTMKKADWKNSHVLKDDLRSEVARLKKAPGKGGIMVHGSGTLVRSLLEQDLLDELRLLVYPLVRGEGKRLFVDMPETKLSLLETRPFASGAVALIYGRAAKKGPKPAPKTSSKKKKPAAKKSKGIGDRLRYGR